MNKKLLLKAAGIFAIIVVVVLIAAVIAIKVAFPPEKIKALVEEQATGILKREVSVGGAGFNLWPLGVKIEGIVIANNPGNGFSKDPMLELPKAIVKIDLSKLLTLQIAIDKISIENLSLLYEVMPDGRTSIDGLGGEPDTTSVVEDTSKLDLSTIELPGSLALNSFEIKNAKVIYNDRSSKQKIILGSINLGTNLSLDKTLENIKTSTALSLKEISFEDAGMGVRKGDISVSLNTDINANLRVQHIDIKQLSVGLQSIKVNVSGTVDRFLEDIKVIDLKVESNTMNLAELIKEIPAGINPEISKVSASGTAAFSVLAKGTIVPDKLPSVNGSIILTNIALNHSDFPAGVSALTGNISFTENAVTINPFSMSLAGQPTSILLEASNLLSPQPTLNNLNVNANLDLGVLFGIATKLVSIPEVKTLTGNLKANISAKGILDPAHPERINVNGSVVQNIATQTTIIPDAITLNGNAKFSNTEISADQAVVIGSSDVEVKAVVKDYLAMVMPRLAAGKKTTVNVDVHSSNLELDKLLPPGDATKPEEEESIPMEIYPELPDIIANVNVNLANTVFRHLTLSDFFLGVNLANSNANVTTKGRLYTGTFNADVGVNLANRKSADVKFAMNVNRVEANDFITNGIKNVSGNSEIAKQIRSLENTIFGKFSMQMDVRTKGLPQNFVDNLAGPISVEITNGSLRGSKILASVDESLSGFEIAGQKVLSNVIPRGAGKGDMTFDDLDISLEASNGQLLVKDFDLNAKALGLLAFTGAVGFDGALNLNLQNTLNSSISSKMNNLTKASPIALYSKDAKGNALLFFKIGGTFADPKITLDASKMENPLDNLKDAAMDKVNEIKDKAKEKVNQAVDKAKAEAERLKAEAAAKAKAEADRIKAEAQAKADQIKAEADAKKKELEAKAKAEADKKKAEAADAAKKKLGNMFKK